MTGITSAAAVLMREALGHARGNSVIISSAAPLRSRTRAAQRWVRYQASSLDMEYLVLAPESGLRFSFGSWLPTAISVRAMTAAPSFRMKPSPIADEAAQYRIERKPRGVPRRLPGSVPVHGHRLRH